MAKGYAPRPSDDPNEERMLTWRYPGALHNRLINITQATRTSLNYYVTMAIIKKLEDDEAAIAKITSSS